MNLNIIEEPVNFIYSPDLLLGNPNEQLNHLEIENIIALFFEQGKYSVSENIEQEQSKYQFHEMHDNAEQLVNNLLSKKIGTIDKKYLVYRKLKTRKENRPYDDFFFSVFDEVYNHLRAIAVYRAIFGIVPESFMERLFYIYKKGFLPIQYKDNKFIYFNPIELKRME